MAGRRHAEVFGAALESVIESGVWKSGVAQGE
jgi:hypothetical protein